MLPENQPTSPTRLSRRQLFRAGTAGAGLALLGGGALFSSLQFAPRLYASGAGIEALLLTCMDYRLVNEVTFFMNEHSLTNQYDQVILAGATLGVATDKFPAWAETFWKHLELAVQLHQVKRVIAIDHRDCGAYKLAYSQDFGQDPVAETDIHTQVMTAFRNLVKQKQPNLEVELLLMYLDGHVQPIGESTEAPAAPAKH
jgi:carbonic anhydrase-like protein